MFSSIASGVWYSNAPAQSDTVPPPQEKLETIAPKEVVEAPKPQVPKFSLDSLVKLQQAEGYWNLGSDFCKLIGVEESAINNYFQTEDKRLTATSIAVKLLEKYFNGRKEEWEMLSNKAKKWMQSKHKLSKIHERVTTFIDTL